MNPYSHIVVASKLEALVKPADLREYYWGAIAPDVRYIANIPRSKTHISANRIRFYREKYPHTLSFLQGYLVHCLADEAGLLEGFTSHFPFSLIKGWLSRTKLAVLLELYYFENERVDKEFAGSYNEVLYELGISRDQCTAFSQAINLYASSTSPRDQLESLFDALGLKGDARVEKYLLPAKSFQRHSLLKVLLFQFIKTSRIHQRIIRTMKLQYQQMRL